MNELIDHCDKIATTHKIMRKKIPTVIDDVSTLLKQAKANIQRDPSSLEQTLNHLQQAVDDKLQKDADSEKNTKEFYKVQSKFLGAVNRFSKDIDKRFKQDLSTISNPEAFQGKEALLRRALAIHFIRQGQFELCDLFLDEAGVAVDDELRDVTAKLKAEFINMYAILKDLEEQRLSTAIAWAQEHHNELLSINSSLEFNLHRLQYVQLLGQHKLLESVLYAQKWLGPFRDKHFSDIKRMMTATLFSDKLRDSPYADLCSPTLWTEICIEFQRDFCSLLNMSAESPLYASVLVGTTALPVIMKLYKIISATKTEWSQQDELPVELPLSEELRFHSIFACPVSKEQASEDNPPMMMPCGHVICRESLQRLSKSSRNSLRFKCPYCPSESSVDQAVQVYF